MIVPHLKYVLNGIVSLDCHMLSKLSFGDLQVVTGIAVFRDLTLDIVEHIVASATAITLKTHESLCRHGDPATAFFIVTEGHVKLYRVTLSGDETIIQILTKGDSFAEAAALTGGLFLASCDAVSEARVVRIPADHVVRCVQKNPDIALAMIASTIQHVHYLMEQVEQLKAQSGLKRLAEFLVSLSSVDQGPTEVVLPCNKVLLAGWLGLRPESLSRAFVRLKSHGVAMHASYVNIHDVAKLHQLASHNHDAIRGSLGSSFH
jgi:CRP-like cAMP-binding protein